MNKVYLKKLFLKFKKQATDKRLLFLISLPIFLTVFLFFFFYANKQQIKQKEENLIANTENQIDTEQNQQLKKIENTEIPLFGLNTFYLQDPNIQIIFPSDYLISEKKSWWLGEKNYVFYKKSHITDSVLNPKESLYDSFNFIETISKDTDNYFSFYKETKEIFFNEENSNSEIINNRKFLVTKIRETEKETTYHYTTFINDHKITIGVSIANDIPKIDIDKRRKYLFSQLKIVDLTKTTDERKLSFTDDVLKISFEYPEYWGEITIKESILGYETRSLNFSNMEQGLVLGFNPEPPELDLGGTIKIIFQMENLENLPNYCAQQTTCEIFVNKNGVQIAKDKFIISTEGGDHTIEPTTQYYIYVPNTRFKEIIISDEVIYYYKYFIDDFEKQFEEFVQSIKFN
jgi:hypothetical protein